MGMEIKKGSDLFAELIKKNINLSAYCGGKEKCGKCKVRIVKGTLPVTETETKFLTVSEKEQGIRLACCHRNCEADVVVEVGDEAKDFEILGLDKTCYDTSQAEDGIGIAVDIGTTTIVIAQMDLTDGHLIRETKLMNPQRKYGADVISRIQACNEQGVAVLQKLVLDEIRKVLLTVEQPIRRMYVCGNSTMEHIFLGIEPRKISEYPYVCEFEEWQTVDSESLFSFRDSSRQSFPVTVLPNIAAFVGGDIVAGIVSTGLYQKDRCLLIDLGTNGEMALSHNGVIYTTSTAAGPAFEGGNMVCGVASIPGAVCQIRMEEGEADYRTIADQPPIGICGSGYIEGISEILSYGWMDETGYMEQDVEIEGEIRITPADIRNFQLAKSAVRTGINILCRLAGMDVSSIDTVYISGGFGKASNLAALANLKIIPKEFIRKTKLLGNTALDGTIQVMLADNTSLLNTVKEHSRNVDLASDERFNEEYMENMWF